MKYIKFLFILIIFLFSRPLTAAYSPSLNWQQLETNHFIIYYPEALTFLAQKSALHLEKIYLDMGAIMQHYPEQKTILLITDHTDSANGSAQAAPLPIIHSFVTPAADLSELMDMADRTESLLSHEYMHILQLDTTHSLPWLFNTIFGPYWLPNAVQPNYLIEGFAVYAESMNNQPGRLNSPLMTGYIRALAAAGELPNLGQLANARDHWPYGTTPYLLGGHLMRLITENFESNWPAAYSHFYGQAIIPYFIMTKTKLITEHGMPAIYKAMISNFYKQTEAKERHIKRRGHQTAQNITTNGQYKSAPLYHDHKIYFVSGNPSNDSQLYSFDLESRKLTSLTRAQSSSDLAINNQLGSAYFTINETQANTFTNYNQVLKLDLQHKRPERLKNGPQRVQQPVFNHSGEKLAYIINEAGKSQLWIADSDFSHPRLIRETHDSSVIYYPQFSQNDQILVTAVWRKGGTRYFELYQLQNGSYQFISRFSPGGRQLSGQHFSADGQTLYFHADLWHETFNIFALQATEEPATCRLFKVTDELAGAFYPLEAENKLFYLKLEGNGYNLVERPINMDDWRLIGTTNCPGLFAKTELPVLEAEAPEDDITSQPAMILPIEISRGKYRPFHTLLPRMWLPTLGQDPFGQTLGFTTSATDILGHHSYSISADWGLTSYYPAVALSYTNHQLPVTFTIGASHYLGMARKMASRAWASRYAHKVSSASLSLGYELDRWNHSWYFSATYLFNYYDVYHRNRYYGITDERIDLPGDRYGAIGLYASFSTARSFHQSLHNAKGLTLSLGVDFESPALGSNHESYSANFTYRQYQQIPILRSTLAWKIQGAFGYSPEAMSQLFTLGGPGNGNILSSIQSLSIGTPNYLRGFELQAASGNSYLKGTFEWRLLLWKIERAPATLPIYFDTLHLAFFCDVAYVVDSWKEAQQGQILAGPGAELRLDVKLGYYLSSTLSVGYAHGHGPHGINNIYVLFGYLF